MVSAADSFLPNADSRMNAATDSRAALAFCSTTAYSASLNCISLRLALDFEERCRRQAEALERAKLLNEQAEQLRKETDRLGNQ